MNKDKFSVPTSSDTSLSVSHGPGTSESEFFDLAGLDTDATCGKFVITRQYRELLIRLNKPGRQRIVLRGPKGVGKSVTLGTLAAASLYPTLVYCGAEHLLINRPTEPQPAKRPKVEDTGEF